MIHESLELIGYLRFRLNRIESFSISLSNPVQVILGTNGSGKSSLLMQLVQLVPPPQLFDKAGSKTHVLSHKGRRYVLKAVFSPSAKYYFEVDGEVLNDWGVGTIQKQLVEEHFGLTPMVQRMMLGEERLHQMSAPRRREWIIHLCATDHTYAIDLYQRARDRLRDIQGALRMQRQQLALEIERKMSDAQRDELMGEVKELHDDVTQLIEARIPPDESAIEAGELGLRSLPQMASRFQRLAAMELRVQQLGGYTPSQVQSIIDRLRLEESSNRALMEATHTQLSKLSESADTLKLADQYDADQLAREISELTSRCDALLSHRHFPDLTPEDVLSAHVQIQGGSAALIAAFTDLPSNADQRYSRTKLDQAKQAHTELRKKESYLSGKIEELKLRMEHHREHQANPKNSCPKCGHHLNALLSQAEIDRIAHAAPKMIDELAKVREVSLPEMEEYLACGAEYERQWRGAYSAMRSMPALQVYWDRLMELKLPQNDPQQCASWVEKVRLDLERISEVKRLGELILEKGSTMAKLRGLGGADRQLLRTQLEELTAQYGHYTSRQVLLGQRIAHYQAIAGRIAELGQLQLALERESNRLLEVRDNYIENLRREALVTVLQHTQSVLASREDQLYRARQQQGVITHIEDTIRKMEVDEQAAQALVKALSPSEGLIARSLFGFIRQLVSRMNDVISSVWNYEMKIQPCELSKAGDVDLDYLFPVKVQGGIPLKDVKEGSKGMIEIMDLAFKIVALGYMGHHQSALILDELGSAMDQFHRVSFIRLIADLTEKGQFPQIFVVSHDYEQCSALSTASVCVLCTLNVAAPSTANRHVEMS